MTKKIDIGKDSISSLGTQDKWYKGSSIELLSNDGKTPIRLDKVMLQVSTYHTCTAVACIGCLVHITDETGASLMTSVTAGITDDASLEVLLNQWKDNVFMTDFRLVGTGNDESVIPVWPMEADTRRLLMPGQKLYASFLIMPTGAETTKSAIMYFDSIIWYSAAAQ